MSIETDGIKEGVSVSTFTLDHGHSIELSPDDKASPTRLVRAFFILRWQLKDATLGSFMKSARDGNSSKG
jgi:hypothetical protein